MRAILTGASRIGAAKGAVRAAGDGKALNSRRAPRIGCPASAPPMSISTTEAPAARIECRNCGAELVVERGRGTSRAAGRSTTLGDAQ